LRLDFGATPLKLLFSSAPAGSVAALLDPPAELSGLSVFGTTAYNSNSFVAAPLGSVAALLDRAAELLFGSSSTRLRSGPWAPKDFVAALNRQLLNAE